MKKEDSRVVKTKQAIFRAFVDLTLEKDLTAITVQDIAQRALINRSTFYSHFHDKQDVLDQVFSYALQPLLSGIEDNIVETGNVIREQRLVQEVTKLFLQIQKEKKFYLVAFKGRNNLILLDTFKQFMAERFADVFSRLEVKDGTQLIPNDFIISYLVTTFTSTVYWWLENDCPLPAEQMARVMIKLISSAGLAVYQFKISRD